MNRRSLFIAVVFIATFYAISALAQVPAAPPKIAFINTEAFYDDKAGITKLVTATKQLDAEFATQIKALEDGNTKLKALRKNLKPCKNFLKPNSIRLLIHKNKMKAKGFNGN